MKNIKNITDDQLIHILYERVMEFYKDPANHEKYERWRQENEKRTKQESENGT